MFTTVLNDKLQSIRDEITTNASRLNLALNKQSADLITITNTLTERIDDLAQLSSSSRNPRTGVSSTTTPSNTPIATGTNLLSALGSHSSKYGAGGIKVQIQDPDPCCGASNASPHGTGGARRGYGSAPSGKYGLWESDGRIRRSKGHKGRHQKIPARLGHLLKKYWYRQDNFPTIRNRWQS